jgi:hypothetical protein
VVVVMVVVVVVLLLLVLVVLLVVLVLVLVLGGCPRRRDTFSSMSMMNVWNHMLSGMTMSMMNARSRLPSHLRRWFPLVDLLHPHPRRRKQHHTGGRPASLVDCSHVVGKMAAGTVGRSRPQGTHSTRIVV